MNREENNPTGVGEPTDLYNRSRSLEHMRWTLSAALHLVDEYTGCQAVLTQGLSHKPWSEMSALDYGRELRVSLLLRIARNTAIQQT